MMKKVIALVLGLMVIALTGCVIELDDYGAHKEVRIGVKDGIKIETGELRTYEEAFDLESQDKVDVTIEISASDTTIGKSTDKLFQGKVETNIVKLRPEMTLNGRSLTIRDNFSYNGLNNPRNDWDLKFSDKTPMDFSIRSNASRNDFDFTGMMIEDLSLRINAANTTINFDEKNGKEMRRLSIESNAGNLDGYGLGKALADDIEIISNAGRVSLDFGDSIYKDTDIEIDSSVSEVVLDLPDDVGIYIRKRGSLSSVDVNKSGIQKEENNEYKSSNYDTATYRIDIEVNGNAAHVTIN